MSDELELYYYYYFIATDDELSAEEKKLRDRRIPRCAVKTFADSPFKYLYDSGDNQALMNVTAVDHQVFRELLAVFEPFYSNYMLDKKGNIKRATLTAKAIRKGRPRHLDATGCLALVLYWYRTRGSCARAIAWVFGLTSTPMYNYLKFGRRLLMCALLKHRDAKVMLPNQSELQSFVSAISNKYPILKDVWGACDGLKIPIEKASNYSVQNNFYNGWTSGHYVNCVFTFSPDGKIRMCALNCPGCWHDSTMASYGVYEKIVDIFKQFGFKVVVDSAFKVLDSPSLIKSSQQDPIKKKGGANAQHDLLVNRAATSVRQLSEWGMRMIQGQFPRLKEPLAYEEQGERKVILQLMILLYNYQTSKVGINQILNTFMVEEKEKQTFFGREISADANNQFLNS